MRCDLKCPPMLRHFCCNGCRKKPPCLRLKDEFEDLWSEETGFYRDDGCVLGEDRPDECKMYDCKEYDVFVTMGYRNDKWVIISLQAKRHDRITGEFISRYNKLLEL